MTESKELEALHLIARKVELADNDDYWEVRNAYATVEQALTELQQIKSAEPTKALECLEKLCIGHIIKPNVLYECRDTIKQALMSKSNAERCWEIVKNKKVNIYYMLIFKSVEQYNEAFGSQKELLLTEEEFEKLKRELK